MDDPTDTFDRYDPTSAAFLRLITAGRWWSSVQPHLRTVEHVGHADGSAHVYLDPDTWPAVRDRVRAVASPSEGFMLDLALHVLDPVGYSTCPPIVAFLSRLDSRNARAVLSVLCDLRRAWSSDDIAVTGSGADAAGL